MAGDAYKNKINRKSETQTHIENLQGRSYYSVLVCFDKDIGHFYFALYGYRIRTESVVLWNL
jgi:hypothetical protein